MRPLLSNILSLLIVASVAGQQSPSRPSQQTGAQEDVVRVTTNLVQLDVVVTDKDGKPVSDLRPEDFEVTEDRDKRQISSFSYITLGPPVTVSQPTATASRPGATTVAPAPLRPEEVHRTIVLLVDDLGLSFESIISVKDALRKFVNEQMQPKDLVAVLRTSRGIGSLQQFTTDKRQLLAAIDNINWYASGRSGLSPSTQIDTQLGEEFTQGAQLISEMEESRAARYSVGTLQTLGGIVQGLRVLPGRKAIMLYAESFKLFSAQGRNVELYESLKRLTDQANQSSTVIYTIDASGVNPQDMTASDRVSGATYTFDTSVLGGPAPIRNRVATQRIDAPRSAAAQAETDSAASFRRLEGLVQQREEQQNDSRTVLSLLAEETGGTFTQNSNNLSLGTQRMLEAEQGYYLIGFRPEDNSIDPATGLRRFHEIKVKVKRSGLRVRSRAGFYGVNLETAASPTATRPRDEQRTSAPTAAGASAPSGASVNPATGARVTPKLTREQQLTAALGSPFAASGIGLRVTPLFGNDPTQGSFLRVLLHVDTQDLTFSTQPDGSHKAVMDIVAVNFGSEGRVIDQFSDTQTINVKEAAYQQMLKEGLAFVLHVPAKKPGPMQLRVAVRDTASERIGSASQFVEAPDLTKNRLALSGLLVSGSPQQPPAGASASVATGEASADQTLAGPAVRHLRQGMILSYAYTIYNAQLDSAGKPQLQTQMRLFKDGKEVFTGKLQPFSVGQQTDMKRLDAGGRLLVGGNLVPGEYVLQVTVTDALAKNKRQGVATQWIDFKIAK